MAEAKGVPRRRVLRSAEAFSEAAMARGSSQVHTPGSRSRAWLLAVTCRDHRWPAGMAAARHGARLLAGVAFALAQPAAARPQGSEPPPPFASALVLQRSIGTDPVDVVLPQGSLSRRPPRPLPLALVLQGANVDKRNYAGFAWQLARHGFVVVVPNHRRRFPPIPLLGRNLLLPDPHQIPALLQAVAAWNREAGSPLAGRLDGRRLVVVGHSMGGLAGLNAIRSRCDWPLCSGRFRRPEALIGGVFYGTNLRGHGGGAIGPIATGGVPVALIQGSTDGLTRPEDTEATFRQIRSGPKALITVPGANHYGITDSNPARNPPGMAAAKPDPRRQTLPQGESIARIARWSALFLRATALKDGAALQELKARLGRAGGILQLTGGTTHPSARILRR